MPSGRSGLAAVAIAASMLTSQVGIAAAQETPAPPPLASPEAAPARSVPQPSYDVIRVEQDGTVLPYVIWAEWMPVLVATPDGGAWAFFTAQVRTADGLGGRKLYAARFDPAAGVWLPARAVPGGQIQFGPAAVVDRAGVVHLVFSDRASDAQDALSTMVYTRSTAEGGWDPPTPIAPDPNAGHQMMPSLAIDGEDRLHLLWRDQRGVSAEARAALVANADLFASDYVDGAWTPPVQVNDRSSPDLNAGWPYLAVDGDRLVAVWSTYKGTTAEEMRTATRVEWSSRGVTGSGEWAKPATLLDRRDGETGGRSIDLVADPRGGLVLLYGRLGQRTNDLFLRRLDVGAGEWGAELKLGAGDLGYLPSAAISPDGTAYLVFNNGRNRDVEVGALALPPDGGPPAQALILTPAEDGEHGRVAVAFGANGQPWILYMHAANGSANATEIRALRGARMQG